MKNEYVIDIMDQHGWEKLYAYDTLEEGMERYVELKNLNTERIRLKKTFVEAEILMED